MTEFIPYINIHTHNQSADELSITTRGVHPYEAESGMQLSKNEIDNTIDAIGEIGLDFSRSIDVNRQELLFCEQLSLAEAEGLPVVIHAVRSVDRVFDILGRYTLRAVIFHGFIGSEQQAKRAFDRGYYLSFGHRTFASPKTIAVLRAAPLSQIFFETDDEPVAIENIYRRAAAFRGESLEQIKMEIFTNYNKLFKY